jgi:hypothetical protein
MGKDLDLFSSVFVFRNKTKIARTKLLREPWYLQVSITSVEKVRGLLVSTKQRFEDSYRDAGSEAYN